MSVAGALTIEGELILKSKDKAQSEMRIMNSFVEVNSPNTDDPKYVFPGARDGGLEVYRGDGGKQDARIVWVEKEKRFKAGIGEDLKAIAYGNEWDSLIKSEFADLLHRHSKLSSPSGLSFGFTGAGKLYSDADLALQDERILLLKGTNPDTVDHSHGLGWFGAGKPFAAAEIEGPVLFGGSGGALGTRTVNADGSHTDKQALSWSKNGYVGIGPQKLLEDSLDVEGSVRLLSGRNPLRFTSAWTGFPDKQTNGAEISNDTTDYKALMIVGNNSAGQKRKVAIWDRLDVNGFLYVNGTMQASQEIIPSAGNGEHSGIIFPANPGGGGYDQAWIKYYPRAGEDCTLEIGTSNDRSDHISLIASGNVGVGTLEPADKLDVAGEMRILSGQNPVRFTSGWTGFTGQSKKNAEISNDTTNYNSLMIAGNGISGVRRVSIWDNLDVNGSLQLKGAPILAVTLRSKAASRLRYSTSPANSKSWMWLRISQPQYAALISASVIPDAGGSWPGTCRQWQPFGAQLRQRLVLCFCPQQPGSEKCPDPERGQRQQRDYLPVRSRRRQRRLGLDQVLSDQRRELRAGHRSL